jgi:hypothetical protein
VALIAGGYWRVILSACAMVAALIGASIALFGIATWSAFLTAAAASGDVYAAHAIFMGGLTSPYGVLMTLGAGRETAFAAQAVVTLLCACVVALVWRSRASLPMRAAILLAATPVAVPVLMFYDLMLVLVALVWLSRVPAATPLRHAIMVAVFLGPLLSGNLSTESHWLLAAATASAAFGLTLAVAWRELAAARSFSIGTVTGAA